MQENLQNFGPFTLAQRIDGTPVKLPRAQNETVLLAFDNRIRRFVELHVLASKNVTETAVTEAATSPLTQPTTRRRLVRQKSCTRRSGKKSRTVHSKPWKRKVRAGASARKFYARHHATSENERPVAGPPIDAEAAQSVLLGRAREILEIQGRSFMPVLEVGEDDGLVYFTCNLEDGEFIEDYARRNGALAPVTSLVLVHQLLDDLLKIRNCQHLVSRIHMSRVLVTAQEDAFLQLRLFDYGLAQEDPEDGEAGSTRLLEESCRLLFLLMTGRPYDGGNPGDFPAIAELPLSLRLNITSVLTNGVKEFISIRTLADEIREAICLKVTLVQARNPRRLLAVEKSLLPQSHLQDLLLEHVPVETVLGPAFLVDDAPTTHSHAFAISASSVGTGQALTLNLLPPARIIDQCQLAELPPRMWRCDPLNQPNLLHVQGLWKGPDWAFLAEEREPGFALSRLMADRQSLNPNEVSILLKQISAGMDQAVESGMQRVSLNPPDILLCVGYDGPVLPRDRERLLQKRLDAWPKFVVKLRLHKTMRSLYEAPLIDLNPVNTEPEEDRVGAAREHRSRTFICLASYLLTGEGQIGNIPQLSLSLPQKVESYLLECLNLALLKQRVPSPGEFIEKLDLLLSGEASDSDLCLPDVPAASEEMHDGGFVSDFEADLAAQTPCAPLPQQGIIPRTSHSLKPHAFQRPGRKKQHVPWAAMAAAAAIVLGLTAFIYQGGGFTPAGLDKLVKAPPSVTQELVDSEPAPPETAPAPTPEQQVEKQAQTAASESIAIPNRPLPTQLPPSQEPGVPARSVLMTQAAPPEFPQPVLAASQTAAKPLPEANRPREVLQPDTLPPPLLATSASNAKPSDNHKLAEEQEPVVIRRAITLPQKDAPPMEADLPSKTLAANLPPLPPSVSPDKDSAPAEPEIRQEATSSPASPGTALPAPAAFETTASIPLTIRHAIVLTPEEMAQIDQEQGSSSAPDTARPSR